MCSLKTLTTNLGVEGYECSLAGYMLEEPSIILRLSCLLHVFINTDECFTINIHEQSRV